jgi:hypothetical protein
MAADISLLKSISYAQISVKYKHGMWEEDDEAARAPGPQS